MQTAGTGGQHFGVQGERCFRQVHEAGGGAGVADFGGGAGDGSEVCEACLCAGAGGGERVCRRLPVAVDGLRSRQRRRLEAAGTGTGDADAANHGVDAVAVAVGVGEALEDDRHGAFAGDGVLVQSGFGEAGAEVAGEFHAAGEREIEFAALEGAHGDFQGAQAARVFAAHGVALAADAELLRDAAGVGAGERAHRAVGVERRVGALDDAGGPGGGVVFGNVGGEAVGPVGGAVEHGPAEVEIRRAEVEAEADEDAGARGIRLGHAGVGEGVAGDFEHEGLLREQLGEFARRDAVAADGDGEVVNEVAGLRGEGFGVKAAPVGAGGGLGVGVRAEDAGGEGAEVFPRADVRGQTDDGDGRGLRVGADVRRLTLNFERRS